MLSGRFDDNRTQEFSNYVHIQKMRSKNKVALAVELSIYRSNVAIKSDIVISGRIHKTNRQI